MRWIRFRRSRKTDGYEKTDGQKSTRKAGVYAVYVCPSVPKIINNEKSIYIYIYSMCIRVLKIHLCRSISATQQHHLIAVINIKQQ